MCNLIFMKKIFYSIALTILAISFYSSNSIAATANTNQVVAISKVDNLTTAEVNYRDINKQLSNIEKDLLNTKAPINSVTSDYIKTLNDMQDRVNAAKQEAETNLGFVQKRIEALGEAPKEGAKEPYSISSKRKEFTKEETDVKSKITEADLILTKIDELEKLISNIRNKALLDNILDRQQNFINPKIFLHNTKQFFKFTFDIVKSPVTWFNSLTNPQKQTVKGNALYVSIIVAISLIFATFLSVFIKRHFGYRKMDKDPDYSNKFFAAISVLIAYGIIPAVIIGAFLFWIKHSQIINVGLFGMALNMLLFYLLYIFIAKAIVKVVFVPKNSKWRLISVDDTKAKSLNFAFSFSIIVIGVISFLELIAIKAEYPPEIILYTKMISCLIKTFCIILIANRMFCRKDDIQQQTDEMVSVSDIPAPKIDSTTTDGTANTGDGEEDYGELTLADKIKMAIYVFAVAVFSIALFGFINLSDYILNRSITTVLIIGLAYIASNTIEVLFHRLLLLKFWIRTLKFKRRDLAKIDIWFGAILNPIIVLLTIFFLLGLWGASTDLMIQKIKKILTGFYVGGVKISITSILLGILVYFVSMSIFKFIKLKFLSNTLEKMDIDYAARNSLSSGFSFFGFLASIFFAIAVMGGSISNLAIIAGALSFGIGLGLQNIINNFVSGVIILFERPIKIGDVVNINGQEGTVKQISIRATELETGVKSSVIIPNANIISGVLVNLTHNNKQTRIDLRFLVDIDNDPKEVMKILLDVAQNNKKIMIRPAPTVSFNDFSNNSLDFTLSCYIMDISNKQNAINDLRIDIFNKFNEEGIQTALPQRIIYVEPTDKNKLVEAIPEINDTANKTNKSKTNSNKKTN